MSEKLKSAITDMESAHLAEIDAEMDKKTAELLRGWANKNGYEELTDDELLDVWTSAAMREHNLHDDMIAATS
jgi:hypothetical protein